MKRNAEPSAILVVDDEDTVREMLGEALATLGYRVLIASSAEAALEIVGTVAPDLVLADVHMGAMTGIELCATLKADERFQLTPVVLLTAVADRDARVAGLTAGADDFFAKPCDLAELQARIASLLRIKRLHDELETKNRLLRTPLGRYVSESVAAEIVRHPEQHLRVGGEKREVTIVFADLRGFTPLADSLDAEDVVHILNRYLGCVVDVVFAHGGTLDKFRGDGVMAMFGAPVKRDDDPAQAVRCALALHERVRRLGFERFPDLRLHLGIGVNTGAVIVGPIGSERRMDYTAIGNEVNVAARFEANAGPGQTLITANTYALVKPFVQVRELGSLRVKGKGRGVAAFDVLEVTAEPTDSSCTAQPRD